MWNGRWSRELSVLYDKYYEIFAQEPDCGCDIDFDDISYNEYVQELKKSILLKRELRL